MPPLDALGQLIADFARKFKVTPLRGRLQSREEFEALLKKSLAEDRIDPGLQLVTGIQNGIIVD